MFSLTCLLVAVVVCVGRGSEGFERQIHLLPRALADSLPPPVRPPKLYNEFAESEVRTHVEGDASSTRSEKKSATLTKDVKSERQVKNADVRSEVDEKALPRENVMKENKFKSQAYKESHRTIEFPLQKKSCGNDDYYKWRWIEPRPAAVPGPIMCGPEKEPRGQGTAPPNVCDLCPATVDHINPLDPCTCVGNSGTGTGKISITCPHTIVTTDQLRDIFTNTDFFTTHVFRFTLRGSNMSGVLNQDLWGPLDFTQVIITDNKINYIDNMAFIGSADTLTLLNLDNNRLNGYVQMTMNELPNLTTLILSNNCISLVFSSQYNYTSLRELDLSHNLIDSIGQNGFAGLDKLEILKLDHNLLTSIDDDSLTFNNHHPDTNFLEIDLSYNQIKYIGSHAMTNLKYVQINLQQNHLVTIAESVFSPIIMDSQYYAYFIMDGNDISCDCALEWVIDEALISSCFDNFPVSCHGDYIPLYLLENSDLGNCSLDGDS